MLFTQSFNYISIKKMLSEMLGINETLYTLNLILNLNWTYHITLNKLKRYLNLPVWVFQWSELCRAYAILDTSSNLQFLNLMKFIIKTKTSITQVKIFCVEYLYIKLGLSLSKKDCFEGPLKIMKNTFILS